MLMKKSKQKRARAILSASRAVKGHMRETHFASGGDLTSWRGRHDVYVDKRKEQSRRACRKKLGNDVW